MQLLNTVTIEYTSKPPSVKSASIFAQVNRSKVTRLIKAVTESVSYLLNGKAYEVQTWYTDGAQNPVSSTSPKVKGQGRDVTWCVWQVLPISGQRKVPETPNLVGRLPTYPRAIMHTTFKIKRSKVKVTRQINARVADATWLMWSRSADGTAVGDIPCPRHSLFITGMKYFPNSSVFYTRCSLQGELFIHLYLTTQLL